MKTGLFCGPIHLFWTALMGCACVLPARSIATELPITTHSFEAPILNDGVYVVRNVPGWTGTGLEYGVANPANDFFSGTTDGGVLESPIDGRNAALCNVGSRLIYQNTNILIQANAIYKLTFLAGRRIS